MDAIAPEANPDLFGHDEAQALLLAGWDSGRLAHAWLITGPEGVGKASFAYRAARFLLNDGAGADASEPEDSGAGLFGDDLPADQPAGAGADLTIPTECETFDRVARRVHPDLRIIERTVNEKTNKLRSEIVVEDVRNVMPFLHTRATNGGWRVIVVDRADEMNRAAQNAILKTLEEPPQNVCLLLVATNPGKLLPTIRSRCRMLPLSPLGAEDMGRTLSAVAPDLDIETRMALIELADGSPGRALDLEQGGGLEMLEAIRGLASDLPGRLDYLALHALADKLSSPRDTVPWVQFSDQWLWWLDHLLRSAARGGGQAVDLHSTDARLVARLPLGRLIELRDHAALTLGRTNSANLDKRMAVLELANALDKAMDGKAA
ncbi:MAG: DNA polymerase III subunit delta' [Alphaproteobacteria bacterium]